MDSFLDQLAPALDASPEAVEEAVSLIIRAVSERARPRDFRRLREGRPEVEAYMRPRRRMRHGALTGPVPQTPLLMLEALKNLGFAQYRATLLAGLTVGWMRGAVGRECAASILSHTPAIDLVESMEHDDIPAVGP